MREKVLDGLSIGYSIPDGGAEVDPQTRVRVLKKLKLWEVSPVVFPANPHARISTVKAADITDERQFEKFLCDAGFPNAFAKAVACHGFNKAASLLEADRLTRNSAHPEVLQATSVRQYWAIAVYDLLVLLYAYEMR